MTSHVAGSAPMQPPLPPAPVPRPHTVMMTTRKQEPPTYALMTPVVSSPYATKHSTPATMSMIMKALVNSSRNCAPRGRGWEELVQ
jgi:hypothetical protein